MLFGALVATIPDVDVLVGLAMNDLDKALFHRGFTHSFAFILLTSPIIGWIFNRLFKSDANWKQWSFLAFIVQLTHVLLDSLTSYGTQLFLPVSDTAVSLSTISVIDPLFTLPLLFACLWLLIKPANHKKRTTKAHVGIGLAVFYLMTTIVNKYAVEYHFISQLNKQSIEVQSLEVKPTLLNNLLWRGIADTGSGDYVTGYFSIVDGSPNVIFEQIEGNHHLISDFSDFEAIKKLKWISKEFFQIEPTENGFLFNDLRFGRVSAFNSTESPYAFSYILTLNESSTDFDVKRVSLTVDRRRESGSVHALWNRIFGIK